MELALHPGKCDENFLFKSLQHPWKVGREDIHSGSFLWVKKQMHTSVTELPKATHCCVAEKWKAHI